ncbi:MAG: tyrosine-type recombinase/integrase [Aquamicrobium sp.]|nr:tyrosine-type recombinase/integrase [Aquamicrobium sp.]
MVQTRQPAISLYTLAGLRKYLTGDERQRFIEAAEAASPVLGTLCLTMAYTGCRISEALDIRVGSIELDAGYLVLRCLKKRRQGIFRNVPVPGFLLKRIAALSSGLAIEEKIWLWSRGRAWLLIKRVMHEAGIRDGPHAMPKGLRHGFGIHAVRSGIPLPLIQRWMGHASIATTAIYLQAIGDEEREIAARMWKA